MTRIALLVVELVGLAMVEAGGVIIGISIDSDEVEVEPTFSLRVVGLRMFSLE
jgi:hypothetical protein